MILQSNVIPAARGNFSKLELSQRRVSGAPFQNRCDERPIPRQYTRHQELESQEEVGLQGDGCRPVRRPQMSVHALLFIFRGDEWTLRWMNE